MKISEKAKFTEKWEAVQKAMNPILEAAYSHEANVKFVAACEKAVLKLLELKSFGEPGVVCFRSPDGGTRGKLTGRELRLALIANEIAPEDLSEEEALSMMVHSWSDVEAAGLLKPRIARHLETIRRRS